VKERKSGLQPEEDLDQPPSDPQENEDPKVAHEWGTLQAKRKIQPQKASFFLEDWPTSSYMTSKFSPGID